MTTEEAISIIESCITGELKTAWDFYCENKPEKKDTFNVSGLFYPNPIDRCQTALGGLRLSYEENNERLKKLTDALLNELNNRDY